MTHSLVFPQAIHGALQKLQEGGTVKDAKAVCEPAVLTQMIKWKVHNCKRTFPPTNNNVRAFRIALAESKRDIEAIED